MAQGIHHRDPDIQHTSRKESGSVRAPTEYGSTTTFHPVPIMGWGADTTTVTCQLMTRIKKLDPGEEETLTAPGPTEGIQGIQGIRAQS
jgi:hypothetical protein